MKTSGLVSIAVACAVAAACSQDAGKESGDEATVVAPRPVTLADTNGLNLVLTDVVVNWGPPMPVTWAGAPPPGDHGTMRVGTISGRVLNATDADMVDPHVTCIFDNADNDSSGSRTLEGVVPAHGSLTFTGLDVGGGSGPGKDITCGVEPHRDRAAIMAKMRTPGPVRPLPGSVLAKQVVAETGPA